MRSFAVRWVIGQTILFMVAVPLIGLHSFGVFDPPEVTPVPFEAAAWRRADPIERDRTVRSQMADDLIRSQRLVGLTRGEVESLLGSPLGDLAFAGIDARRWDMAYRLGLERGGKFSLDDEFLVVRFARTGRVVECRTAVN